MPKLIIGADIVPTSTNQYAFENAQMERIVDDKIRRILSEAEYRIFNLEVPLTDTESPIKKCGPNLIASTKSVDGLKQLGIDFLTLANNHILDQGEQGLWSTAEQLDKVGIAYAGIGHNAKEAAKPHIVDLAHKKIGIYCCAEHEFSIVNETQAGANPFDPLESLDHIANLKSKCDYVICLYHGGKEHYRYPSPYLQKVCRKMIDKGADLIICQHSHCIGCEEHYKDGVIVYGQGNFLFDKCNNIYWQTSLLVKIDEEFNVSYIPLVKDGNTIKLAEKDKKAEIINEFQKRSEEIKKKGCVEEKYKKFAEDMFMTQFLPFTGRESVLFRAINKVSLNKLRMMKLKWRYRKENIIAIRNFIECEAHRELILKAFLCENEMTSN